VNRLASPATEHAVHGLRHADREAAHTTLEGRRPVRFHHQVQMVGLDAVARNVEPRGTGGRQCTSRGEEEATVSEGGYAGGRAQRHVGGTVAVVKLARPVRNGPPPRCGLAAGAITASAPRPDAELSCAARGI